MSLTFMFIYSIQKHNVARLALKILHLICEPSKPFIPAKQLKFRKVADLPPLMHNGEIGTLHRRKRREAEAQEIRFLRRLAGYGLIHCKKNNRTLISELN
jgi:hypothetical protein